jgi:uncharacterized protein YjbI with pentapeptide repeats
LRLSGLEASACAQLLGEHELVGSPEEYARLAALYAGNPLALGIVAETIADLFGGAISPFLSAGTILFNSITQLLQEQWERLSALEQTLLWWLAILREPVTLEELLRLLRLLRGDLRGLDLSQLTLRGAYLQGVEMQDTTLAGARLRECVFTEAFDAITAVAISPSDSLSRASGV